VKTDKVKTPEDLFKEVNVILRRLQTKSGEAEYSSKTCLCCCGRLYPTVEAFWEHLNNHTVQEVKRIREQLLREIYQTIKEERARHGECS